MFDSVEVLSYAGRSLTIRFGGRHGYNARNRRNMSSKQRGTEEPLIDVPDTVELTTEPLLVTRVQDNSIQQQLVQTRVDTALVRVGVHCQ